MKIIRTLFIFFLLLQGCSQTPPTSSPPSLERADNFEQGISKIPEGYSLFLVFDARSVCSDECNCAPEAPAPLYEFTSEGELWIKALDGFPVSSSPIVGFFAFSNWGGGVYVMDTLPFTLAPGDSTIATVYRVDAEGTAVVEVYGETYFIQPGQAWTDSGDVQQESPPGCYISYSTSLTNFGLFPQAQIRFGYTALHP